MDRARTILWLDFAAGSSAAAAGLVFSAPLGLWLGLPRAVVLVISAVTAGYGAFAFFLARKPSLTSRDVRGLARANWLWTLVSLALVARYAPAATMLGKIYLVLQVLVVAGFAVVEGRLEIVARGTTRTA